VPPPRRNANAQQPLRRPRVAGLRRPARPEAGPPADERVSGRLPVDETPVEIPASVEVVAPEVIGAETVEDERAAQREFARVFPDVEPATEAEAEPPAEERKPAKERRPVGERLAPVGRALDRLRPRTVLGPIVMVLIAAVLTAAGFAFKGAADKVLDGGSAANKALTDTGATTDVVTQVTRDMETVSSYKYTDLAGAQKAGQAASTGDFLTDYNKLFEQVKAQAPAQKAVVTGQVAKIGVSQLQGDNAELLVFLTQTTTRADTNKSSSVGLVYTVDATRSGGKWLIRKLTPR
jgi:Mce-associated membrane protein